jgi:putative membrane protein
VEQFNETPSFFCTGNIITTMNEQPNKKYEIHPTDRLANERTFLAWIRTSISIIAFGFVVIKVLLPENPTPVFPAREALPTADNHALFAGICLFFLGAAISTLAYIKYRLTDKQILAGTIQNSFLLPTLLLAAILILCAMLINDFLEAALHLS